MAAIYKTLSVPENTSPAQHGNPSKYGSASHAYHHAFHLLHLAPGPDIAVPVAASLLGLGGGRTAALLDQFVVDGLCERTVPGRFRVRPGASLRTAAGCGDGAARRRLVDHYLHTAYQADRLIAPHHPVLSLAPAGAGCVPEELASREAALDWLDAEFTALVAVRAIARETGRHLSVFHLASCLNGHFVRRGHTEEQVAQWTDAVHAAHALGDPEAQITSHRYAGQAASRAGRHTEAVAQLSRAARIAERHGEPGPQAWTYYIFAWVEEMAGRDREAFGHAVCAAGLFRRAGEVRSEADALNAAGWYQVRLGDLVRAKEYCTRALDIAHRHHYHGGEAAALDSLGLLAQRAGRHDEAVASYGAALSLCRDLGNTYQEAGILDRLGDSYTAVGRFDEARNAWEEAVDMYRLQRRLTEAEATKQRLKKIH
ncbi:tetratricopeptide repeat protein [Streptomyces jumonjinensis]|nr:tetratricopeptide repeat protein [Streptomyces jumonjinensis]